MKTRYQCVQHRWYPSKDIAERELIKTNAKYGHGLQRVYKCGWRLGWHMTKSVTGISRRIKGKYDNIKPNKLILS